MIERRTLLVVRGAVSLAASPVNVSCAFAACGQTPGDAARPYSVDERLQRSDDALYLPATQLALNGLRAALERS